MKSIFKFMVTMLLMCSLCWSCNDWLTVNPKDSMSEDEMFSSARGYESVLCGLYRNMAESGLYGNFLSFGLINVMSQSYDVSWSTSKLFKEASDYRYNEPEFKSMSQQAWETAYNCIANANNFISRLQEAPDGMFSRELDQKNLMLGEAYAVRAYVHFDLLRLYAPSPVLDDGKKYIPYVDYYPCKFASRMSVNDVLGKIVADLQIARKYLAWDTTAIGGGNLSNQWGYPLVGLTANNMFYGYRATRLNFYAVTATLARVLLYRDGEKYEDPELAEKVELGSDRDAAVYFAMMVTNNTIYKWTQESAIWSYYVEDRGTLKMPEELVFALWKDKHALEIGSYYNSEASNYSLADYWGLWQKPGFGNDFRYKYGVYTTSTGTYLTNRWLPIAKLINEEPIIPMIRLSELYYILAEASFYKDKAAAVNWLWQVRYNRGVYDMLYAETIDRDEFVRLLIEDARKEFVGEGKLFFLYKQLNEDIIVREGETIKMGGKFTLPVPDSEFILE